MSRSSGPPVKPPTCKIDWYSFTIPLPYSFTGSGVETLTAINNILQGLFGAALDDLSADGTWRLDPAKGFYQFRAQHLTSGVQVSWGEVNKHLFVELPGQACSWARTAAVFDRVIQQTHPRASRVDATIDIETTTMPDAFVSAGFAKRFAKNTEDKKSDTGETYYVGARASGRCARVYRYYPPHPRAHLLRLEAEYKKKPARELAGLLAARGVIEAVRAAHAVFDWRSADLNVDFLQSALYEDDQVISRDTENIGGLLVPFSQRSSDTIRRAFLMSPSGSKEKYSQRSRRSARYYFEYGA